MIIKKQVRKRSNAEELTTLILEDVFEERDNELAFKMPRRRDLICVGKFNNHGNLKRL